MSGSAVRNVGFGWDAIDIFLFSNGQNASPPRKYHLSTAELDWWEATLNYLAKSHYGSTQSAIELYTLNGDKIESPLGLRDGMPCVAVVPPDTFTDAGYEEYLMRASRSFEKRKARTTQRFVEQSEVKTGGPQRDNEKLEKRDSTGLNASHQGIKTAATTVIVKTLKSSRQKLDSSEAQIPRSIITNTSNLRNDKKRSSTPRASFGKISVTAKKTSKQDSQNKVQKKFTETSEGVSIVSDKLTDVPHLINHRQTFEKTVSNIQSSRTSSTATPAPSVPNTPVNCHTMLNIKSDDVMLNPLPLQSIVSTDNVFAVTTNTNMYNNPIPESKSCKLDPLIASVMDEIIDCGTTKIGVDEETQTSVQLSSCEVNTEIESISNNKIKVITTNLHSNVMNYDVPLEKNCIAIINTGDAVNVKLQIELKDDSDHKNIPSNSKWENVKKASSLFNFFKVKKSDDGDPVVAPSKSLDSVICGINECYTKVVVVECSCCGNKKKVPRIDTVPVYKDPNGFFILMPTAQQENCCLCCRNAQRLCPDTAAMSAMCVDDLCKPKSSTIYPCVQEVGMVMTLTGSFGSQTNDRLRRKLENNVACLNDRYTIEEYGTSATRVIQRLEYVVSSSNMTKQQPSERMDSYTQTDWCSILLRTQRHENGQFSFYLPSLEELKKYSLI